MKPAKYASRFWRWLLLLPYLALLFPSMYARHAPELFEIPFFYWYQFAWVFLTAGLTGIVYWRTR